MKRLLFTFVSLALTLTINCTNTFAQVAKIGAVHSKPTKLNNYLVLNKNIPDVSYFDVIIQEKVVNEKDSTFEYVEVSTTRMQKSFYKKIDARYKNSIKYFIKVLAYNTDDEVIIEEGPFAICVDCQTGYNCQWGCIGTTYAYGLNLSPVSSGSSIISISEISPQNGIDMYYYEYISSSTWTSNYFPIYPSQYYGLASYSPYAPNNAGKIIKLTNVNLSQNIRDASGNILQGVVYKVSKSLGPWYMSYGNIESEVLASGQENCGQTFNWAKNVINDNTNNFNSLVPLLSCNGDDYSPTNPEYPEDGEEEGPVVDSDILDCYISVFDELDNNGTIQNISQAFAECDELSTGTAFNWPEWVENITIVSMSDSTTSPIEINYDAFYDKDGNYIFEGFNFSPGLYYLGLQTTNGAYINNFFERTDSSFQNLYMADFINYNPYPNPLVSTDYQIDFEATCNLEFTYEVKNSSGSTVFSRSYKLDKGEQLHDRIYLSIPSYYTGLLYNKFTFTDNSTIQFTMVK